MPSEYTLVSELRIAARALRLPGDTVDFDAGIDLQAVYGSEDPSTSPPQKIVGVPYVRLQLGDGRKPYAIKFNPIGPYRDQKFVEDEAMRQVNSVLGNVRALIGEKKHVKINHDGIDQFDIERVTRELEVAYAMSRGVL